MARRACSSWGGCSDRCRAANSKRPKAWLAMTISAGVRANCSRSWSICSRTSSSDISSSGSPGPPEPPGLPEPGGCSADGGGSRRIGRSPSGVQSVLIALPYVENRTREAGCRTPTRPPPPFGTPVRPGRSTARAGVASGRPSSFRAEKGIYHQGVMTHSRCT